MSTCPLCGGDPEAPIVESWTLAIPLPVPSQNQLRSNHGPARHRYRNCRDSFASYFAYHRQGGSVGEACGKRRIRITRLWGKRQRAFDHANLVGGCKPIVDALVRERLLVDDTPAQVEGYYDQERAPDGQPATLVTIEVLG